MSSSSLVAMTKCLPRCSSLRHAGWGHSAAVASNASLRIGGRQIRTFGGSLGSAGGSICSIPTESWIILMLIDKQNGRSIRKLPLKQ
jgi:hypothetical protein